MKNIILYMATVLIWGSTWLAIKFQLGNVDPMVSVSYRFFLASLMLFIYCIIFKKSLKFNLNEHFFIILQGIFSFSIAYWFVYLAEIHLTSGLVAVICSSLIFLNIFNGVIFLKSRINFIVLLGAIIGFIGILLIFWPEITSVSFSNKTFIAIIISFLSTLIFSFGNITVERNIKNKIPIVQSNAYSMAYGALIMFFLAIFTGKNIDFDLSRKYILSFFYLSLFGSVIAFYCYFTLIGNIGSDKAAYGPVVVPVITLILSSFFEGYIWSKYAVLGIALLFIGNTIVLNKKSITT